MRVERIEDARDGSCEGNVRGPMCKHPGWTGKDSVDRVSYRTKRSRAQDNEG